jgi:hypothetical protein
MMQKEVEEDKGGVFSYQLHDFPRGGSEKNRV